jgi:hypothetical protein
MSFIADNIDAEVTLIAGLWACHVAWYHPTLSDALPHEGHAGFWRTEKCIGPLLIAFAILDFAIKWG